jgi:3-hydroxyisobutyrate dehydrogenase-like beta-hydroxyacid dehydrogenase
MPAKRIGIIGLGLMGRGMGTNLLKKGFSLTVHDVDPAAVEVLRQRGARVAASAKAVAAESEIVITVVPDGPDVESVVLGVDGVLAGARPGTILVECSTIDPAVTQRVGKAVRAAGCRMVDAGMGRSSAEAEAGKLLFRVGAESADFETVRPVLEAMGTDIFHCGGPGTGISMKMVNNLLNISLLAADLEALALGTKAGLSMEVMLRVLTTTAANNPHLKITVQDQVLVGNFQPGFKAVMAQKDLGLAQNMAARLGVPLFTLTQARQLYSIAVAQGKGDLSMGVIAQVMEDIAGVRLAPR